jgi:hypothetical protein
MPCPQCYSERNDGGHICGPSFSVEYWCDKHLLESYNRIDQKWFRSDEAKIMRVESLLDGDNFYKAYELFKISIIDEVRKRKLSVSNP